MIRRALTLIARLEGLQLAFVIGAIFGMLFEAILITVPKLTFMLAGSLL